MKKQLLFVLLLLFNFSHAKMVNAIAIVVDGEPITTAEIRAIEQQYGVSNKEARELLIQDRLQKSAMKGVIVEESLIDNKIAAIAAQNHLSVPQMQRILKSQGTSWSAYRSSVRDALKKEKFFREHVIQSIPEPSEDELKLYYQTHKQAFFIPKTIQMIEYSAQTEQKMKQFLRTKRKNGIHSKSVTKKTTSLNPALLGTLLATPNGGYTPPFNAGDRYIAYKVLSKNGKKSLSFEEAKGAVIARWKQDQQAQALKNYFAKIKTNADVQILR